jgi:hypothetical protein
VAGDASLDGSEEPLSFIVYVLLAAAVCFVLMSLRIAYKLVLRGKHKAAVTRHEAITTGFFGRWAATEGAILLFLYITAQLGAVVACLGHFAAGYDTSGPGNGENIAFPFF